MATQPILSMSMWVNLSNEERNRIRKLFSIPRSKTTHVDDGQLVTDGTTPEDFAVLTIEKMQNFLNKSSFNFHELFDFVVERVRKDIESNSPTVMPEVAVLQVSLGTREPIEVIPAKRRGRPKKDAQKQN